MSVLFQHRHTLATDVLRSLADTWTCASAAQFGGPYETWWITDLSLYTDHDTAACEAETAAGLPGAQDSQG